MSRDIDARAAAAATIAPAPAVAAIAGRHTRLVWIVLERQRRINVREARAGLEKFRCVRPYPSRGVGPQPALLLVTQKGIRACVHARAPANRRNDIEKAGHTGRLFVL